MRNKKKEKIIVGTEILLLCMMIGILRINAASSNPLSSEVSYNKNNQTNVQGSINDLYSKVAYGDAKASEILSGKKALVGGKEIVGTYTCPTLASQTLGDTIPEDITEGKIAWVNGNKIVGNRTTLAAKVNIGDYIGYIVGEKKYVIRAKDSGLPYDHTIDLRDLSLWRVIRKNADGTVDMVSERVSKAYFPEYYNYIGELNRQARLYEKIGITVGSRAMGYDSTKANEYITPSISTPDTGYETDVELVKNATGDLCATGGAKDCQSYLLASRSTGINVTGVDTVGGIMVNRYVTADVYLPTLKFIRPIVVLRSDLKITGGNGTEKSPYTIGV